MFLDCPICSCIFLYLSMLSCRLVPESHSGNSATRWCEGRQSCPSLGKSPTLQKDITISLAASLRGGCLTRREAIACSNKWNRTRPASIRVNSKSSHSITFSNVGSLDSSSCIARASLAKSPMLGAGGLLGGFELPKPHKLPDEVAFFVSLACHDDEYALPPHKYMRRGAFTC